MRELSLDEIEQVSGGGTVSEFAADGGAIGSLGGIMVTNTLRGAAQGGLFGAAVGASFGAGFAVGTALYDYVS